MLKITLVNNRKQSCLIQPNLAESVSQSVKITDYSIFDKDIDRTVSTYLALILLQNNM